MRRAIQTAPRRPPAELEGKRGMLARVVASGEVAVGDEVTLL
jgi:MOSC domain-containing protein YiiM